jgi:ABC-type transporter Mla MlaB component
MTNRGERKAGPMLKILRANENESVILTLIGRIDGESLAELKRVIGLERNQKLVLDLKDVTLVDQSAIRLLARCEARSVTLENCPAYIRDWIAAEKHRNRRLSY